MSIHVRFFTGCNLLSMTGSKLIHASIKGAPLVRFHLIIAGCIPMLAVIEYNAVEVHISIDY